MVRVLFWINCLAWPDNLIDPKFLLYFRGYHYCVKYIGIRPKVQKEPCSSHLPGLHLEILKNMVEVLSDGPNNYYTRLQKLLFVLLGLFLPLYSLVWPGNDIWPTTLWIYHHIEKTMSLFVPRIPCSMLYEKGKNIMLANQWQKLQEWTRKLS